MSASSNSASIPAIILDPDPQDAALRQVRRERAPGTGR